MLVAVMMFMYASFSFIFHNSTASVMGAINISSFLLLSLALLLFFQSRDRYQNEDELSHRLSVRPRGHTIDIRQSSSLDDMSSSHQISSPLHRVQRRGKATTSSHFTS
jgi:hypothetical protein